MNLMITTVSKALARMLPNAWMVTGITRARIVSQGTLAINAGSSRTSVNSFAKMEGHWWMMNADVNVKVGCF